MTPVTFDGLASSDLTVGRVYEGGRQPHVGADPLPSLIGVGNMGGFRQKTLKGTGRTVLCALFSTGEISEWPDRWDGDGNYVYFGDQRSAGKDLLETPRGGNKMLASVDSQMRAGRAGRELAPLLMLFETTGYGRGVQFDGLLVPAARDGWLTVDRRETPDGVITNFRAVLSPLDVETVTRFWLSDVQQGYPSTPNAPEAWTRWVQTGESR